ncbi:MAG: hypothetical protein AAF702_24610 [Chloroflexota bacterium]
MCRQRGAFFLLATLSLLAIWPLLAPGYFYSAHDGRHSVFYLIQFDASFQDGALWPRWAMHHTQGYGYPTFIIQAPLGFYFAELFILLGAGYTLAAKLSWIVANMMSGWGMYVLVHYWLSGAQARTQFVSPGLHNEQPKSTKEGENFADLSTSALVRLAALAAALIYIFVPYHLLGIYVRAALNDTLLLAWFPWVIYCFERLLVYGQSDGWPQRLALAALSLGGILLTHAFALISFTPLLISFILFRLGYFYWQERKWRLTLSRTILATWAGLCALLLYANFLLPLFMEGSPYLKEQVYISNTYDFRRHFVYWGQFFSPFWGLGYSDDPTGANDGMGFQVGALLLMLTIVAAYQLRQALDPGSKSATVVVQVAKVNQENHPLHLLPITLYLLTVSVGLLALMTPWATSIWESVSLLAVIQFPWRLLSLASFTLSASAGFAIWSLVTGSLLGTLKRADGNTWYHSEATAGCVLVGLLAIFSVYPIIGAPMESIEPWREDGRAIAFFENEHPDMMGYTKWVQENFTESPMSATYLAEDYREDYTEGGPLDRLLFVQGNGEVLSRYSRGSSFGGRVRADIPSTVRILLYHFPGWQVTLDGEPVEYAISEPEGLIDVEVPVGEHQLEVHMGSTIPRRVGSTLSFIGLAIIVVLFFVKNRAIHSILRSFWKP